MKATRVTVDTRASFQVRQPLVRISASAEALTFSGYVLVGVLGFIVRFVTLKQYTGQVDEPASLMAIKRVAQLGYPQFPSGVLYLQNAVYAYIAAPLAWFLDGDALFQAARVAYLFLSLAVIPLSMKLAHSMTASLPVAIFVGILVACDPNLIVWSIAIRPYGLLAAEVVAFMLLFVMLLKDGAHARFALGRAVAWIPIIATLGTFTHIGFWLVVPGLVLTALIVWKRSLLGAQRLILLSGALSGLPLVVFLFLGKVVGPGSGTRGGRLGSGVVGSHLFSLQGFIESPQVTWSIWTDNYSGGELYKLTPYLITLLSGALVYALLNASPPSADGWRTRAIAALLVAHWSSIAGVAILVTSDPDPRYLMQVVPLGYVLAGLAIWGLWRATLRRRTVDGHLARWGILLVLVAPALAQVGTAAAWRVDDPGKSPDYWAATAWTSEQLTEGQVVITALPPPAFFWFAEEQYDSLYFLAGPEDSVRTARYIKPNPAGEPGDYWLGTAPIASVADLCSTLREYAGAAWLIVDVGRLNASWALKGEMQRIIIGATRTHYEGAHGVQVRLALPADQWSRKARAACAA